MTYSVIVEFADSPDEVYGPFETEAAAVLFAEEQELGGYTVVQEGVK